MSYVDHLLDQAVRLASSSVPGRPRQADLRRAVSAGYYAVFHEVVAQAVSNAVGSGDASAPLGLRLRRVIPHKSVKTAAQWFTGFGTAPTAVRDLFGASFSPPAALQLACRAIVELQHERHWADYDLTETISKAETLRVVAVASQTVADLRAMPRSEYRTTFLVG